MKFKQETGAIISSSGELLSIIDGNPGFVDFPPETILQLHQMSPGIIGRLTHTHPPGVDTLSGQDIKLLKSLAFSLYPFPIRLGIIKGVKRVEAFDFYEQVHTAILEDRFQWKSHGGKRSFTILSDEERWICSSSVITMKSTAWMRAILEKSYQR